MSRSTRGSRAWPSPASNPAPNAHDQPRTRRQRAGSSPAEQKESAALLARVADWPDAEARAAPEGEGAMSLYQLHRCVFAFLREGEDSSGATPDFDVSSYDLTDEERKIFESKDIAALYQMGFHPVLLNGYCRAIGYERSDYRAILASQAEPVTRTGRWHHERP